MIPRGLYPIVDTAVLAERDPVEAARAALAGGAVMLQYRDKSADGERRLREARGLVALAADFDVPVLINDDPDLATASGAAGVHVGADDAAPGAARSKLGPDARIGVSCYDDLARAHSAAVAGADYIAFGRMFLSATKPGGPRPPLSLLGQARTETGLAVCAIGGITVANAPQVIAAGADLIAVIGDLWDAADITERAAAYTRLFPKDR